MTANTTMYIQLWRRIRPTDDWYPVVARAKLRLNQPKRPRFSCLCPLGMGFNKVAHRAGVSDIARKTDNNMDETRDKENCR